ncbi:acyl-CoA dehydrogenase [Carbonactinospora thermoautotrophica]|uniref:Acyl-CoA dehydrogenase n=1 Tax=Carbonactinospora thermoautotrophica TaxID=1469144 RepID=A0A132NA45_9ACTN|nr:acyl-CoA dehydrogenase family protein [Carbonactinospora thermoautotrophica]KWX04647.1 acyl-CoA dehydrogenase [Carbonactinospora thermoautotrophica]KWX06973.1 acyl-CoA dehydrogenase [Carbonactinospora thermoautotrophica]
MAGVERFLPTDGARALLDLTRELAVEELAPKAAEYEAEGRFPREVFRALGRYGLLGLPYPREYGGGAQPYAVYLQVLEELASAWLTVGLGVGVHTLACYPLARYGTPEQRERWLPGLVGGELLGAYCLSEPHSGSDAAALSTRAVRAGEEYVVNGAKAWTTHGGVADFYSLFARTADTGPRGITAFLVPAGTPGLSAAPPERKMGLKASTTAQIHLDDVRVPAERRVGAEGQGFPIALSALDSGRLGVAACAVGLAQAAFDVAVAYAKEHRVIDFAGLGFLLADLATQIEAGRAVYLAAARRRDEGLPFTIQAAMAKLFCTDMAMKVTTDAVQVLGGDGYLADHPAERYLREAKALQIVEGTNQIQRLVISRRLAEE